MAVANGASFFSRFTMKFVEVIGAGIATAVTGYLIAHLGLGGLWSTPTRTPEVAPASVQMSPAVSAVPKSARVQPAQQPASVEVAAPPAAKPDATADKEPAAAEAPPARAAIPVRKSGASEPKPHEAKATEPKPRERDDDTASVEEQVRAALAKVDASRRPPAEPAAPVENPPATPAAASMPPPAAALPAAPAATALPPAPPVVAATPNAPAALAPPLVGTVEIKSQPVATVDATPTIVEPPAQAEDKGILATLKKIPDMLRPPSGATSTPPRPPLPVGE